MADVKLNQEGRNPLVPESFESGSQEAKKTPFLNQVRKRWIVFSEDDAGPEPTCFGTTRST
jgi:hypothetical protein